MALIPSLTTFSPGTTIVSADVNANYSAITTAFNNTAVLTDVARTISVSHTFSAAQKFADGTVSAPGLTFANDTDCGLYRIGANNIGFAINGAKVGDWSTTGLGIVGTVLASDGTVSLPAFSFTGDTNTGFYRIGVDNIGVSVGGVKLLDLSGANVAVTGVLSVSSTSSFTGAITATGGLVGNVTGNCSGSSGSTTGNAATATKLQTARTINGVSFDGTANITVSAATVGTLTFGTYLQAGDASFSGSAATISTNATALNTASTLVARDGSGNFAAGTITATFTGNLTGNVAGNCSGSSGSTTGNAATATILATTRTIWGQNFNGSANVSGALSGATTGAFSSDVTVGGTFGVTGVSALGAANVSSNNGQPLIVNNSLTAASFRVVLTGQRGGTDRWHVGVNASDQFTVMNAANSAANLTVTDAGALTVRSDAAVGGTFGVTGLATFSGDATVTRAAAVPKTIWARTSTGARQWYAGVDSGGSWFLQDDTGGVTAMSVTAATGAVAIPGAITGGTYNGQTISSSASFTGSVAVALGLTVAAGTAAVQALTATTGAFTGAINTDSTTDSTSGTTGALQSDGGLGVAKSAFIGETLTAKKLKGGSGTPGISTPGGTQTSAIVGNDSSGTFTLADSAGGGPISLTITYASAYSGTAPVPTIDNMVTGTETGTFTSLFVTAYSTTAFTVESKNAAVTGPSSQYRWSYKVIQ